MKLLPIVLISLFPLLALGGCETFSIDKERASEHRKQSLCARIDTKDLPHCSGQRTEILYPSSDLIKEIEDEDEFKARKQQETREGMQSINGDGKDVENDD